ncbi:methyltransferase [Carex rostrata]
MDPPLKPRTCRNLFVRILLFGVVALALRFAYVVVVLGGAGCGSGDFCLFSSPEESLALSGSGATTTARTAAFVRVHDGGVTTTASPSLRALWTSREWRRSVEYYSSVFNRLRSDGYLSPSSHSLCVDTPVGYEVLALKEIGVSDAIGVAKKKSLPLVRQGNPFNLPFSEGEFDFVFAGCALDRSKRPADLAAEIARVVKPQGFVIIHTTSAQDLYSLTSLQVLFPGHDPIKSRKIKGPDSSITLREIIIQKIQLELDNSNILSHQDKDSENLDSSSDGISVNNCSNQQQKMQLIESAEPLIEEEPLKPWIALKRNAKNIKYLPSLADISFKRRYVYIDVGARSYGSSIGSWFRKQYPKQNHTFEIYAIEADHSFYDEYKSRKGITLLPYAAWVRNETLSFEINRDHDQKEDEKGGGGMGRIRPVSGSTHSEVRTIKGFDFANWVKQSFSEKDYVVMKMDVEGTEFDLIPRLFQTGAICLIDELFLECHYNRWQRCCKGVRSPKYKNTYGQCLDLFQSLRQRGVLVHQWW